MLRAARVRQPRSVVVDRWRGFCSRGAAGSTTEEAAKEEDSNKPIVAAAVLERLPVYARPPHPTVAKFRELSLKWKRLIGEIDVLEQSVAGGEKERNAATASEPPASVAQTSDRRSLQRALDERLYLIVHGTPYNGQKGTHVWHFPEKVYADEDNLRKCAESALEGLLGDLTDVYFAGHAPSGHLVLPDFKRFYFKSHIVGNREKIESSSKYRDYAWVSREELVEYLDATQMELLQKMLPQF